MACQSSTMAGANCFSGHGLLECGLDPRKGTLCRCAAVPLCRPRLMPTIPSRESTRGQVLWRLVQSDMIMHSLHQEPESKFGIFHIV